MGGWVMAHKEIGKEQFDLLTLFRSLLKNTIRIKALIMVKTVIRQ